MRTFESRTGLGLSLISVPPKRGRRSVAVVGFGVLFFRAGDFEGRDGVYVVVCTNPSGCQNNALLRGNSCKAWV